MRQSKFTETQLYPFWRGPMADIRSMGSGDICGISFATYYKWKAKYGGLDASDVTWLKELEHENNRLKRMYADLSLKNLALKDVIEKKL